jgi:hypothetical protein
MPAVALSRVGARVVESGPDGENLAAARGSAWRRCLWPRLQAKVRRDVASGKRMRVPAARVGVRALRMAGGSSRQHVAMRVAMRVR